MPTTKNLLLSVKPDQVHGLDSGLDAQAHDELRSKDFVARCLGENRLLGGDLSEALVLVAPALAERQEAVSHLCGLTRSHVVLADALDDKIWDESTKTYLEQWRDGVKAQILQVMTTLNMPVGLFDQHEVISRQASEHFDFLQPLKSVRKKLEVFFLSLKIPELVTDPKVSAQLEDFAEHYLFALQLIDDFADIPEDFAAPKNHNLFVGDTAASSYQIILSRRQEILPELLDYLDQNLIRFHQMPLFLDTIFEEYLRGMEFWIMEQRQKCSSPVSQKILPLRFSDHQLPLVLPDAWLKSSLPTDFSPLAPDISAPAAHRRLRCFLEAQNDIRSPTGNSQ